FGDRYKYYEAIADFSKEIIRILDLEKLLKGLIDLMVKTFGVEKAAIFLLNEHGDFSLQASYGINRNIEKIEDIKHIDAADILNCPCRPGSGKQNGTMAGMKKAWLKGEYNNHKFDSIMEKLGADVCIPFIIKEKKVGFLTLSEKRNHEMYNSEDIELLTSLANQAAIAIENAKLIKEIEKSRELLQRTEQLSIVGNLAARIAHEVRNPLVAIGTFIQMLPHRFDDPEFRTDFYKIALEEFGRINGLINELLNFATPKEPNFVEENLHDVIEKMLLLTTPKSKQKNILVIRDYDPSVRLVWMDAEKMKQVFLNLICNAIEFNSEGGTLTVRTKRIEHGGNTPFVQIEIIDTGIGIPKEDVRRIFDPYFTTKHKSTIHKGAGLGLFISHQHITEHHGTIEVDSKIGKGTTFRVKMPINRMALKPQTEKIPTKKELTVQ
ncbi:MAG: GAF domain-containing protein, partial [Nitrospirae bacterium]|nr:GAF domain-containing protein [Nitrospirota bacterium]